MAPKQLDFGYRSRYSRCCQIQRRFFGLISLPVLNYDAVFLYSCGLDAGVVPRFALPVQRCCRFQYLPQKSHLPDLAIGRFAGAVSVLFAEVKLRDDLRDGSGTRARFGLFTLRRSIARAWAYFDSLDSAFLPLLGRLTAQQVALETGSPTLEEFISPTAHAVSAVAQLLPGCQHCPSAQEAMGQIGYHLGSAIVATDCAVDWESDLAQQQFNPVTTEKNAMVAEQMAVDHINQIVSIALETFGPDAHSARLAADTAARLLQQFSTAAAAFDTTAPQSTDSFSKPLAWCVRSADTIGQAVSCLAQEPYANVKCPPAACSHVFHCGSHAIDGLMTLGGCILQQRDIAPDAEPGAAADPARHIGSGTS